LSPSNEETDGFEKSSRKNHEHFLFDPKPVVGSDLRAAKIVEEESHAKARIRMISRIPTKIATESTEFREETFPAFVFTME
jgi:hypothetical protein